MFADDGQPPMDGSSRQVFFDPPAELPRTLFGLGLAVMPAVFEAGSVVHEKVSSQERLDGGERFRAWFGCSHLPEFYGALCNHRRARASA